jgi:hypothetical protein
MRCAKKGLFLSFLLAGLLSALPAAQGSWTWESLVDSYGNREEVRQQAHRLRGELLDEAPEEGPRQLWMGLSLPEAPRKRAARSLALIEALFPGGDPARWEEVGGFWNPQEIPLSLAALDGVYGAALALADVGGKEAPYLASWLLRRLLQSPKARVHAFLRAPSAYDRIVAGVPPFGPPWPLGEREGSLPLARPVRGWVSQERALLQEMTFLDGQGRITSGSGFYAWDREKGALYRVREGRPIRWWISD